MKQNKPGDYYVKDGHDDWRFLTIADDGGFHIWSKMFIPKDIVDMQGLKFGIMCRIKPPQ